MQTGKKKKKKINIENRNPVKIVFRFKNKTICLRVEYSETASKCRLKNNLFLLFLNKNNYFLCQLMNTVLIIYYYICIYYFLAL